MPTHHLYVSGHNPYHKLLPHPDLPSTFVYTPTDVLHPVWRDHARTSYGIEELAGEYVWGGYACSLIRLFDGSGKSTWIQYIFLGHPPEALLPQYTCEEAAEWDIPRELEVGTGFPSTCSISEEAQTISVGDALDPAEELDVARAPDLDVPSATPDYNPDNHHTPRSDSSDSLDLIPLPRLINPLKNLPDKLKVIGFDQPEGWLDLKTGIVRRLVDGRAVGPWTNASGHAEKVDEHTIADDQAGRWRDVVCLTDGTTFALPLDLPTRGVGLYRFPSFSHLLDYADGDESATFLPLSLPPDIGTEAITLHAGTSHLLVWVKRPYEQVLGVGDNRFHSATPFPPVHQRDNADRNTARRPGHVDRPTEIETLSAVPLTCVAAGEMISGAVSQGGEAWVWGKGVGPGRLEPVRIGRQDSESDQDDEGGEEEDCRLLAIGEGYEVVVLENDRVYIRGSNEFGQLGFEPSIALDDFGREPDSPPDYPEWTPHPFFRGEQLRVEAVWTRDWAVWIKCVDK